MHGIQGSVLARTETELQTITLDVLQPQVSLGPEVIVHQRRVRACEDDHRVDVESAQDGLNEQFSLVQTILGTVVAFGLFEFPELHESSLGSGMWYSSAITLPLVMRYRCPGRTLSRRPSWSHREMVDREQRNISMT